MYTIIRNSEKKRYLTPRIPPGIFEVELLEGRVPPPPSPPPLPTTPSKTGDSPAAFAANAGRLGKSFPLSIFFV
jgi:hypothetical protein